MTPSPDSSETQPSEFSLPFFVLTVLATLAGLLAALRLFFPDVWAAQFLAPAGKTIAAFLLISLVNSFMEYFFHRYVLHVPAIPFLRRLYRQHTLHHALTHIIRRQSRDGRGILFIENKFPITEPGQHEAAFFPWYSLAVFAGVLSPLLALLQWLAPSFPWFLAGLAALAVSLSLYEVLHAINHWAFERWAPLLEHPRWGVFWRPVYGFHLRHHAVTDCNESISGFFGLPLADWACGTCVIPETTRDGCQPYAPTRCRRARRKQATPWTRFVILNRPDAWWRAGRNRLDRWGTKRWTACRGDPRYLGSSTPDASPPIQGWPRRRIAAPWKAVTKADTS